jgi:hypothetical protein
MFGLSVDLDVSSSLPATWTIEELGACGDQVGDQSFPQSFPQAFTLHRRFETLTCVPHALCSAQGSKKHLFLFGSGRSLYNSVARPRSSE